VSPADSIRAGSIRVVVADDQEIVRTGLAMILDAQPGIEVVGQAADGHQAVALAQRLRPDVCLFDIRMPGLDGIEATRRLAGPDVAEPMAVVVITTFDLDEYVHGALKAGARGFLLKDAGPQLLTDPRRRPLRRADRAQHHGAPARHLRRFGRPRGSGATGRPAHRSRGGGARRRGRRADEQRDR
jgi:CheY-like chemotaxis protein